MNRIIALLAVGCSVIATFACTHDNATDTEAIKRKSFEAWIEAGGDRKQAVDDAVDVCIEQGILRDILIRERTAIVNMVLSCTKKQYERLVEKELEQQEKQLREGKKKMEEQERLLELNRKLVSEKEYVLLEQIQNDPELTQKLLSQYGI